MKLTFFNKSAVHIIVIAALGLLAYSNTLNVPFQWDDNDFILENSIVKDLNYFLEPSKAKGLEYYGALKGRYIGYLTFALNYSIHGLDVRGYHVFNITVHVLNALLVYFLVLLTFKTPFSSGSSLKAHSRYIALFSSLLFVTHPVQTEAVTYIFQRLASLAAFFYLLSLTAYISSRLSTGRTARYTLYTISLVSAVLAMKTKENAFTLPLVITLYEFLFFRGPVRHRIFRLVPLLLTLFIVPLMLTGIDKPAGEIISGVDPATRGHGAFSRWDYLFTEFRVVVTYMRLLFLPINQNLDYDYPVFRSFFDPQVLLSFLFLLSVAGLGVYFLYRSRFSEAGLRLAAFGLFWFFITLSVESSIIPLPTVIDEYRVYLPSAGIFMATMTAAFVLMRKLKNKKIRIFAVLVLVLIPVVLTYAAYARNGLWRSNISLWEDVVEKSPERIVGHLNLGTAYAFRGVADKAIEHYRIVLRLSPYHAMAHNNLGVVYGSRGLTNKAMEHLQTAVGLKPDFAEAHYNLGLLYLDRGLIGKARVEFKKTLQIDPGHYKARRFLNYISSPDKIKPH